MTQEDKQLLLKDLCIRLPYGVKVKSSRRQIVVTLSLDIMTDFHLGCTVKPYLRPMSSMTEEERLYFHRNSAKVQILVDEEKIITKPFYGYTIHLFDWLNAHHFDYRGLIPMGLALEAPEDMYKTE